VGDVYVRIVSVARPLAAAALLDQSKRPDIAYLREGNRHDQSRRDGQRGWGYPILHRPGSRGRSSNPR